MKLAVGHPSVAAGRILENPLIAIDNEGDTMSLASILNHEPPPAKQNRHIE